MIRQNSIYILVFALLAGFVLWVFLGGERFHLPSGETMPLVDESAGGMHSKTMDDEPPSDSSSEAPDESTGEAPGERTPRKTLDGNRGLSTREVFVTDDVKHSIPLEEILSGGPPKDGIPSIDAPRFDTVLDAESFLTDESIGLGVLLEGEARFYPYQILVWHEIVNDTIAGEPVLVTYCPLCATGVVFDRRVGGVEQEFGVSGLLWKSNLLMYNRTGDSDTESLWSQVLGESVLGPQTGERLKILRSDTVSFGEWRAIHPDTKVLSRETGALRSYGRDPYGSYYTDRSVGFGAQFNDTRLHPKAFVFGVEVDGVFKAYPDERLSIGTTVDTFAGEKITIRKSTAGEVDFFIGETEKPLPSIDGFWFSWLAVHEDTALYQ